VENLVAYVLSNNRARCTINLCPYINIFHHHAVRSGDTSRIHVRSICNDLVPAGDVHEACDIHRLLEWGSDGEGSLLNATTGDGSNG
jgi:hypothetical protein